MKRVNDYEFYQLAAVLHPLRDVEDGIEVKDFFSSLVQAKRWLSYLLTDELVPLVVTKPVGLLLNDAIETLLSKLREEKPEYYSNSRELQFTELWPIRGKVREFETILSAELQSMATYFVSQKLAYDTRLLIEEAERLLAPNIISALDDATIEEIRQAGRCVAFDIPTAAAFHIIRATESVIREYYQLLVGVLPKVKARNWGAYIRNLKMSGKADAGVLAILFHIKETYRNPILHPEATVSPEEAQIIVSLCGSAITQMVLKMIVAKPTVTAKAVSVP